MRRDGDAGGWLRKAPATRVLSPGHQHPHPGLVLQEGAATGPRCGVSPGLCPAALARSTELVWGVRCQGDGDVEGLGLVATPSPEWWALREP